MRKSSNKHAHNDASASRKPKAVSDGPPHHSKPSPSSGAADAAEEKSAKVKDNPQVFLDIGLGDSKTVAGRIIIEVPHSVSALSIAHTPPAFAPCRVPILMELDSDRR